MTNEQIVTENTQRAVIPWKYVIRERLIAELHIRAHAWRNQEYVARDIDGDADKAEQCKVRAEVLEQLAHDLDDPRLSLGAKVGAP